MKLLLMLALLASSCLSARAKVGPSFANRPTVGGDTAVTAATGIGVGAPFEQGALYWGVDLAGRFSGDLAALISSSLGYVDTHLRFPLRVEARFGRGSCFCADAGWFAGAGLSMLVISRDENAGGGSDHGINDILSSFTSYTGLGVGFDVDRVLGDANATIVTLNVIAERFVAGH